MSSIAHYIPKLIEDRVASRRAIYAALNSGALKGHKNGKRTVILDEDLRAWLNALPAYEPKQAA